MFIVVGVFLRSFDIYAVVKHFFFGTSECLLGFSAEREFVGIFLNKIILLKYSHLVEFLKGLSVVIFIYVWKKEIFISLQKFVIIFFERVLSWRI